MKAFQSIIIKQVILFIILLAALQATTIMGFTSLIEQKQKDANNIVNQFISASLVSDSKVLSRQLKNSVNFEFITIKQLDETKLYSFKNTNPSVNAMAGIFESLGLSTTNSVVTNKENNLKVNFKISLKNEYDVLQQLILMFLIAPIIVLIISLVLLKGSVSAYFESAAQSITHIIKSFITNKGNDVEVDWNALPNEFGDTISSLKSLSSFFNRQSAELKESAEKVMDDAYRDTLTGLGNRNRFVQYFEAPEENAGNKTEFGILALIRCSELMRINQDKGYQAGDKYVADIADIIQHSAGTYLNSKIFRLNGSDFSVVLPNITPKEAEKFAHSIQAKFNEYQENEELKAVGHTGIVAYTIGKPLGELLALADTAISLAYSNQTNGWHIQKESSILENVSASYGNQNWRQVIDDVLTHMRINLLFQPIQATNRGAKAYAEVLSRFKTAQDQILPTASFLSMAEKLDRIVEVDKAIIELTLDEIKTKNLTDQYFGVNITPKTSHNEQFMIWLERRLLKDANIASKLIFEVSEFGLQQNVQASKRFIDMVHRVGARVTVERFGISMTSFKFFRELKPDFIKMDSSYTRNIDEDKNNQYFIRMMVDLAHRIGVSVFAECVETQEEKHVLESLLVDGTQGYFIGKPNSI